MKFLVILTGLLIAALPAYSQIQIVDSGASGSQINIGQTYTQNFDTLVNIGTASVPWVNNSTLPGWHSHESDSGPTTAYHATTGVASGGLASFGSNGNTERALGTGLNLGAGASINFGVQFVNNSSSAIGDFSVSFDGEQWQRMSNFSGASDSLSFSYQVFDSGTGSISTASGWVSVSPLTFTSPSNVSGFETLNGNLSQNRVANINSAITGASLQPGQELWIRWTATNLPNYNDHSLAIDNLAVTFITIPEPAACAALLGTTALLAVIRLRKRAASSRPSVG